MSRSTAMYYTPEGEFLGYGLYNGTVDVQQPWIVDSVEAAWSYWYDENDRRREQEEVSRLTSAEWAKVKSCSHEHQACLCYSQYGGGFFWPGTYCAECRVFLGPYNSDQFFSVEEEGHPFSERFPEHDIARWREH